MYCSIVSSIWKLSWRLNILHKEMIQSCCRPLAHHPISIVMRYLFMHESLQVLVYFWQNIDKHHDSSTTEWQCVELVARVSPWGTSTSADRSPSWPSHLQAIHSCQHQYLMLLSMSDLPWFQWGVATSGRTFRSDADGQRIHPHREHERWLTRPIPSSGCGGRR